MSALLEPPALEQKQKTKEPIQEPHKPKRLFRFALLLLSGLLLVSMAKKPFIEYTRSGKPKLAKWRKEKLQKELDELRDAEQYVLIANHNGFYPCFSCLDNSQIYLYRFEVYKYGMTTKGEKGRYQKTLKGAGLTYSTQFKGTIQACLKLERIKIYKYALLPENIKRQKPLIRPPGNKQDS